MGGLSLLQVVSRLEPVTKHLEAIGGGLHPELLYHLLLPMAGELATFTVREKHPPEFPTYRHDDPAGTFEQCPGGACHPYPD